MAYIILLLAAIFFSAISSMVGLGGGLFLIPTLILLFDVPVKIVAGVMLLAMVPYSLVAVLQNFRHQNIDFRVGILMELGAALGVWTGAHYSTIVPDLVLRLLFTGVVFYLILSMGTETSTDNPIARLFTLLNSVPPHVPGHETKLARLSVVALFITGFVAGSFSGLLGIGGGFLAMPILILAIQLPPRKAVGTSMFMILITALIGSITHIQLGHVNLKLSLLVAAGMVIGALGGTHFLFKISESWLRSIIRWVLAVAAILVIFR